MNIAIKGTIQVDSHTKHFGFEFTYIFQHTLFSLFIPDVLLLIQQGSSEAGTAESSNPSSIQKVS